MYYIFIPKVTEKEFFFEGFEAHRQRVLESLRKKNIKIVEVLYQEKKIEEFCLLLQHIIDYDKQDIKNKYPKKISFGCRFCEYQHLCKQVKKND